MQGIHEQGQQLSNLVERPAAVLWKFVRNCEANETILHGLWNLWGSCGCKEAFCSSGWVGFGERITVV